VLGGRVCGVKINFVYLQSFKPSFQDKMSTSQWKVR
jgi:hypothetical protein